MRDIGKRVEGRGVNARVAHFLASFRVARVRTGDRGRGGREDTGMHEKTSHPGRVPETWARLIWHPFRMRFSWMMNNRWCRSPSLAQPPAKFCQASGLEGRFAKPSKTAGNRKRRVGCMEVRGGLVASVRSVVLCALCVTAACWMRGGLTFERGGAGCGGMKSARPYTITPEQDAYLCAKYRARYPREIAEYKAKYGIEPDLGTLIAAEARRECNDMTEEEGEELLAHAMSIINGEDAKIPAHA